MCRKCLEKMQDPKFVVNPENIDVVKTMVKIMQEDCLKLLHSIGSFTEKQIGKPVSPAAIGLAWGWFYYASVFNHIQKGDFTLEDFNLFDTVMKADTQQGCKEAWDEAQSGDFLFLTDETDIPEELNKVLESLGLSPLPKPPEGGDLN